MGLTVSCDDVEILFSGGAQADELESLWLEKWNFNSRLGSDTGFDYAKAHCSQMGPCHTFEFDSQLAASGHLTKEQPPRCPWDSQGDREAMFPLAFSISGS